MCGLCGMAMLTKPYQDEVKFFRELCVVTSLRGEDSSGIAYVNKDNTNGVIKSLGARRFRPVDETRLIMAHFRDATVGKVTEENAHPFDTGRYIGAHNGTMGGGEFWEKGKTDSQNLFETIERDGFEETMSRLRGDRWKHAYALQIYDKQENEVILYRNHHRPLYMATVQGWPGTTVWASEDTALKFLASRQPIPLSLDIQKLEPYVAYRLKVGSSSKINKKNILASRLKEEKKHPIGFPRIVPVDSTIGPQEYSNEWDDLPIDESGLKGQWGTCVSCQSILVEDAFKNAERFTLNGKTRLRCSSCQGSH